MDNRLEEEDREALASMSAGPSFHKGHSYSQQIRAGGYKRSQLRKHSLDEERIPKISEYYDEDNKNSNHTPSSSDDNLYHRFEHSISLTGEDPRSSMGGEGQERPPLEEFTAAGGVGIFRAPNRSAVHPHRPAAVELRPHPLRETQGGRFLRTIGCTETQLWAGQESGVRFWHFRDMFEPGAGLSARVRRGDEDTAPFTESGNTAPTFCLLVDEGNRLVWTGHKDGKIRSWKTTTMTDQATPAVNCSSRSDDSSSSSSLTSSASTSAAAPFKEGLSWQAHKAPILSMAISSYGDIWTGSEGGAIRVWPWESVEKSLSLSPEEKHMAALLVERSFIDLKSQVTVNGVCNIPSSDVRHMLSDHARGRVWCAGSSSFSIWDARTKELIKVFNIEGVENRVDMPTTAPSEQTSDNQEEMMKAKQLASKKDKTPGFLQRSRNAIMGAADAVRRVATRSSVGFNEDNKKTECIIMTPDGMIWSGCSNGLLIQWDGNGNRLQDFSHHNCAILCFCTQGSRLWVGYASGMVQMVGIFDGNVIAGWVSHSSPVVKLALGGGFIFSLATHGGIRAWNLTSPGPLDEILRRELAAKETMYTKREQFKILVGTWNVSQGKPPLESLKSWLGSTVSDVGIVVVGLQEVEMGAGFLAMSAAKETVGLEGSAIGQLWQDAIGKAIDEGPTFERVGSRQLAALLIAIWVRKSIRMHVGDLDVGAVACGLGRTIGNKGGVGLRLRVHDRIFCFVNCHLAAHLEAVNRRNADFDHIFRTMVFSRQSNLLNVAAAGVSAANQANRGGANPGNGSSEETRTDLAEADMVVFSGDFNYRLKDITYDEARDLVSQRSFDWLRDKDQLKSEMGEGKVFQGMREAVIRFPPTYKFERNKPGLGGYDSGEKKRIPAWCDRVIYRDSRFSSQVTECGLDCPVVSSIIQYEACMDVTESDHKPVRCKFSVHLACVDRSVRRKEFGEIMKHNEEIKTMLQELSYVPETVVSTDNIVLQNQQDTSTLTIINKSDNDEVAYYIVCEGQSPVSSSSSSDDQVSKPRPRGSFGLPNWLEVAPAAGILNPNQSLDVTVRLTDACGEGTEDTTKNTEAGLRIYMKGNSTTETHIHRVRVRYSYAKSTRSDSKTISDSRTRKKQDGNSDGSSKKKQDGGDSDSSSRKNHSDTRSKKKQDDNPDNNNSKKKQEGNPDNNNNDNLKKKQDGNTPDSNNSKKKQEGNSDNNNSKKKQDGNSTESNSKKKQDGNSSDSNSKKNQDSNSSDNNNISKKKQDDNSFDNNLKKKPDSSSSDNNNNFKKKQEGNSSDSNNSKKKQDGNSSDGNNSKKKQDSNSSDGNNSKKKQDGNSSDGNNSKKKQDGNSSYKNSKKKQDSSDSSSKKRQDGNSENSSKRKQDSNSDSSSRKKQDDNFDTFERS